MTITSAQRRWLTVGSTRQEPAQKSWERIGFQLIWLVVFAVPWGDMLLLPYQVQWSRFLTLVAGLIWGFSLTKSQPARPLHAPHAWLLAFVVWSVANVLWTPEPDRSLRRVLSYCQLFLVAWLVHQGSANAARHRSLMQAYVGGCYVAIAGLMTHFVQQITQGDGRYTAPGMDPNDLSAGLALGIPIAFYLAFRVGRLVWVNGLFIPAAIFASALTASRGGLITVAVCAAAVLFVPRLGIRAVAGILILSGITASLVGYFWEEISLHRLSTIAGQLQSRDLNGRVEIWRRGIEAFQENPLLGRGAGTFGAAVGEWRSRDLAAHNTPLGILVEHGLVGLTLFAAGFISLLQKVRKAGPAERKLWWVLLAGWMTAAATLSWENREATWLIWGLCAAQPLPQKPAPRGYVHG